MPSVKVALSAEVMAGGASTVRVKVWVAGAHPVGGVMVTGRRRCARRRGAGQGGRPVAVVDEGHPGRAACRVSDSGGVGIPVVVTVKVPALPSVKVVRAGRGDGRGLRRRSG